MLKCVQYFQVANHNNILGADKLMLFHASDGSKLGPMDQTLKSLLDDQQIYNGQTVILEYLQQDKDCLCTFKNYKV